MKITEVVVHALGMDYQEFTWTAHEPFGRQDLILVEIRTDEGVTGLGEIASGPQKLVCEMLDRIVPSIIGRDPRGNLDIWQRLLASSGPRPGGLGDWDGNPAPLPRHLRPQLLAAIAGIDNALWDLKGKAAGLPVFRLIGGTATSVFTYAVGGMYRPDGDGYEVVPELARFVENGYRAVKMKAGAYALEVEVDRVRAVREAIGPDVLLMVDTNAAYDVAGAIEYANAIERYDIHWFEEPLQWWLQPSDFVRLADQIRIPLAHGERELTRHSAREFIDSGAIRFVQFDSVRYGGFTEGLRVADYAEQKSVSIQPHSWPHVHSHIVSAYVDAAFGAECVGDPHMHPVHHEIFSGGAYYKDAHMHLTEDPGFGITVDWKRAEKLKSGEPKIYRKE